MFYPNSTISHQSTLTLSIPQCKVTLASSGSLGFIVCVKCCRRIDSFTRWQLSLSWLIQSDGLLIADLMILPFGREHSHGKTEYIPRKQVLVRSWMWKIYYLLTSKQFNSIIWKETIMICPLVSTSACSRDSRPRDRSRLGSIFLVSVSPIISRDSRDWGQLFFLVLDLFKVSVLWLLINVLSAPVFLECHSPPAPRQK